MADSTLQIQVSAVIDQLEAGMAGASDAVAGATDAMSASFDEAAAVTAASTEKMALSTKEAAASIGSSLSHIRDRVRLTSEGFKLSAFGTGSFFGGFGALLGAGAVVEGINKLAELVIRVKNLSTVTGISVGDLTRMRDAMAEAGVSSDLLTRALPRLSTHIFEAAHDSKIAAEAFGILGVNTEHWKNTMPSAISVLSEINDHIQKYGVHANEAAAISEVFGLRSQQVAAVLPQLIASLKDPAFADHATEMENSVGASEDFKKAEEQLSESIQTMLLPALQSIGPELARETPKIQAFLETIKEAFYVIKAAWDFTSPNLKLAELDWKKAQDAFNQAKKDMAEPLPEVKFDKGTGGGDSSSIDVDARMAAAKAAAKRLHEQLVANQHEMDAATKNSIKNMDKMFGSMLMVHDLDIAGPNVKSFDKMADAGMKSIDKIQADYEKQYLKMADDALESATQQKDYLDQLNEIQLSGGHEDHSKFLQVKLANLNKWHDAETTTLNAIEANTLLVYGKDSEEYKKAVTKKLQLDQEYSIRKKTLENQMQSQTTSILSDLTTRLNSSVQAWISGQERFGRAMQQVWTGMAQTIIMSLVKAGEQMIVNALLQKSILDSTKVSEAASAARKVYLNIAAIPYVGPFLAPEAAAGAFAAVMAFEKGGIVPRDSMAMLHKDEHVLPASIAQKYEQGAPGSGGGNVTHNHINAMDPKSFSDFLSRNTGSIHRLAHQAVRNNVRMRR